METFRRYEEDFINSSRIVSRAMRTLESANGNVDAVISSSVDIEGELSEAEGYLKAMDIGKSLLISSLHVYTKNELMFLHQ